METRANYIAVGFVTLLMLVLAFLFVLWLGNSTGSGERSLLDVRIRGSVSGLTQGSSVQFNGIDVGRVVGLQLDSNDPRFVVARTEILSSVPVRSDTSASIGVRGLSGGAFIQLQGGTKDAIALLQTPTPDGSPPVILGDPSTMTELMARVNQIAGRTDRVLDGLEALVAENSDAISSTITNAQKFSQALADNSDGIDRLLSSAESMAKSVQDLSGKLDGTIARAEQIVEAIEPETVRKTLDDVSATMGSTRELLAGVEPDSIAQVVEDLSASAAATRKLLEGVEPETVNRMVTDLGDASKRASSLLAEIEPGTIGKTTSDLSATVSSTRRIVEGVDEKAVQALIGDVSNASKKASELMAAIDATKVNQTVTNLADASEGAREVVADISKVSRRVGGRADDIDKMITDASQLAAQLNQSAGKLDETLDGINRLVGSDEANGVMADARATLAEFRKTAQNLNAQVSSVARGINNFTGRGLADTQGLIRDARRSLSRIDRVISNLEQNPASLFTGGGSGIRESGRPRR